MNYTILKWTSWYILLILYIIEIIWHLKGLYIDKTILGKKNEVIGLTFPDFKIYFKATVIKTM